MIRIRTSLIPWHKGLITNLVAWWCRIECGPAGLGKSLALAVFFMSASHMVLRLLGSPSSIQLSQAIPVTPSCINNPDSEGQVLGCCQVFGCISSCFKSRIREIFTILWAIFARRILPRGPQGYRKDTPLYVSALFILGYALPLSWATPYTADTSCISDITIDVTCC